jgi:hypothetical protein
LALRKFLQISPLARRVLIPAPVIHVTGAVASGGRARKCRDLSEKVSAVVDGIEFRGFGFDGDLFSL